MLNSSISKGTREIIINKKGENISMHVLCIETDILCV